MKETLEFLPMYVLVSLFMSWLTLTSDPWSEYKFWITIIVLANGIFVCLTMIVYNTIDAKKEKERKYRKNVQENNRRIESISKNGSSEYSDNTDKIDCA